jgi:hypothetical protein
MINIIVTVLILGIFICCFLFFYLEDINTTKLNKPSDQSFIEAVVCTIALFVAVSGFVVIYYYA